MTVQNTSEGGKPVEGLSSDQAGVKGEGFSFVEILTMCPTGWFIPTAEGPGYLDEVLGSVHVTGEVKRDGVLLPR